DRFLSFLGRRLRWGAAAHLILFAELVTDGRASLDRQQAKGSIHKQGSNVTEEHPRRCMELLTADRFASMQHASYAALDVTHTRLRCSNYASWIGGHPERFGRLFLDRRYRTHRGHTNFHSSMLGDTGQREMVQYVYPPRGKYHLHRDDYTNLNWAKADRARTINRIFWGSSSGSKSTSSKEPTSSST
ncbi:unnamed protein product, partial [Amoebophrya sp. A25]